MTIKPNPMDLTTLSACKSWASVTGSAQDANIQACLTAASIYFLRMTGRGPRNWQNATENPFNQPVDYLETYDGISGQKLFLRNFPINSVAFLTVGGYSVPASTTTTSSGYVVDDQGRAVAIRGGGAASPQTFQYVGRFGNGYTAGAGGGGNFRPFAAGAQQIQVQYNAGFNTIPVVNDPYTILSAWEASTNYSTGDQVSDGTYIQTASNSGTSGTVAPPWSEKATNPTKDNTVTWVNSGIVGAPNVVTIQGDQAVLSDDGVKYFSNGTALVKVQVAPLVGQYFLVAPGAYLFNEADANEEVLISYEAAGTPQDIILAVMQLVALNYKRRNWIGQRSVAMKDVGSTSYTLQMDPNIKETISNYTRSSFSS